MGLVMPIPDDAGQTWPVYRVDVAPVPSSVRIARRVAEQACEIWKLPELKDNAMLLISELATNAVREAEGEPSIAAGVELVPAEGVLEVFAWDPKPFAPLAIINPDPESLSGRGLFLVAAYTEDNWGVKPGPGGKGKTVYGHLKL